MGGTARLLGQDKVEGKSKVKAKAKAKVTWGVGIVPQDKKNSNKPGVKA